jgi:transcriptional regulator with XRE-family HTH domain
MDTGQRLVFYRLQAKHTQESLAAETEISRVTIASIENGRSSPTVATLRILLKGCGITFGEFFQDYGPQTISEAHQNLHTKLQQILESGVEASEGIKINIDYIHGHMLTLKQCDAEEIQKLRKRLPDNESKNKVSRRRAG